MFRLPKRDRKLKPRGGKGRGNSAGSVVSARGQFSGTASPEVGLPLFPARTSKMLRYATDITWTSTSGVLSSWVFTANGMYDPDISSTGHQPMGFDTMMAYYEHYHVYRSTIRVIFKNSTNASAVVSIRTDADYAPLASSTAMMENGRCVFDTLAVNGATFDIRKLAMTANIPKIQGLTMQNFLADPDMRGSSTSNPAEQTYFHIGLHNALGQTTTVYANVIIEYHAVFTEPRPLTQSLTRTVSEVQKRCSPENEFKSDSINPAALTSSVPGADTTDIPSSLGMEHTALAGAIDNQWSRICTCGNPVS